MAAPLQAGLDRGLEDAGVGEVGHGRAAPEHDFDAAFIPDNDLDGGAALCRFLKAQLGKGIDALVAGDGGIEKLTPVHPRLDEDGMLVDGLALGRPGQKIEAVDGGDGLADGRLDLGHRLTRGIDLGEAHRAAEVDLTCFLPDFPDDLGRGFAILEYLPQLPQICFDQEIGEPGNGVQKLEEGLPGGASGLNLTHQKAAQFPAGGVVNEALAVLSQDLLRQELPLTLGDSEPISGYRLESSHYLGVELAVLGQKLIQITLQLADSHGDIPPL